MDWAPRLTRCTGRGLRSRGTNSVSRQRLVQFAPKIRIARLHSIPRSFRDRRICLANPRPNRLSQG
eukprot:534169-Pyramimonas_sp.AAC.1